MVTGPLRIKCCNKLGYEEERRREEEERCVSWSRSFGKTAGVSHLQPTQVSLYSLHLYLVTAESATITHSHIPALAHLFCTGLSSLFCPQNKCSHMLKCLSELHNVTKSYGEWSNYKMVANCSNDVRIGRFKPVFLLLPL